MAAYDESLNSTKTILHHLVDGKKIDYQEIEQTSDKIFAKSKSPFEILKCIDELKRSMNIHILTVLTLLFMAC